MTFVLNQPRGKTGHRIFSVHPVLLARDGYASPGVRVAAAAGSALRGSSGRPTARSGCTPVRFLPRTPAVRRTQPQDRTGQCALESGEGQRQQPQQTSHSVALRGALRGPASTSPLHAALGSGHGQSLQPRRAVTAVRHGGQGHVQTGSRTVTNRANGAEPLCGPWLHCLPPYTFQWPQ